MISKQHIAWPAESDLHHLAPVAQRVLRALPRMSPGHTPTRNRAGHGLEFLDHRAYVAGDALRDIDWRLSARSRHPYTRRFEDEASTDWVVCIDASLSMQTPDAGKWILAAQLAACFSYLLLDSGSRVSIVVHDKRVRTHRPLGRGRKQYLGILSLLENAGLADNKPAGAEQPGSDPGCCQPFIPDRAALCVIGDFLSPDFFEPGLRRLTTKARPPIHMIQVIDRSEFSRLADGALALRDSETHAQRDVSVTAASRESAENNLQALCDQLSQWCREQGIHYACTDTQSDWLTTMSMHLRRLDNRYALAV